ncbi:MAG: peroxiredoxin [Gammaproteobacteria bacterium]
MESLTELPAGLPVPTDDGACDHLLGARLPAVALPSTAGGCVELSRVAGTAVVFCYPMTGRPEMPLPAGWDLIPGARGCTPQACAFRDAYSDISKMGAGVFGVSTQDTGYQREAASRMHLPFPLLSDSGEEFSRALRLPMLEVDGMRLIRRLTLITADGVIRKVFYPVFPPDRNAAAALQWLREHG